MALAVTIPILVTIILFPGLSDATNGLQTNVSSKDLAVFFVIAAFAGVVKGLIGFGFMTIVTPVFAIMIDPTMAVIVLSIPPWILNFFQIGETHSNFAVIRREWILISLTLIGSILGVFTLAKIVVGPVLLFLIGILLLSYVAFQIIQDFVLIPKASHPIIRGSAGFATGFIMAIANIGILFPIYIHLFERDIERYVGLMGMLFFLLLTERILQMSIMGMMTLSQFWLGSAIAVVTLVGLALGTSLRHLKIDKSRFNWLIVVMLLIIGLNILRKTMPVLFF